MVFQITEMNQFVSGMNMQKDSELSKQTEILTKHGEKKSTCTKWLQLKFYSPDKSKQNKPSKHSTNEPALLVSTDDQRIK